MANANETTVKFKADISSLKKGIQQANRQIRLANSEFKASSAGLDDWNSSADGVNAKLTQLSSILDAEKSKLANLEKQYELTAAAEGETSRGAQELLIKVNNQRAAVAKTEKEITKYTARLEEINSSAGNAESGTEDLRTASEKLTDTIAEQEKSLSGLKAEYANVALSQGESSSEAQELARQITALSNELNENKNKLAAAESAADKFDTSLDDVKDGSDTASDGFTIMKGALAALVADGISKATQAFKDLLTETSKASNSLQVQTGASTEEMQQFNAEMNDLYKHNYGESLQDIADSMAKVVQNSKETDPSKIKELTKNALILKDSFGFDVAESMRAVNMLMDQFGVNGDEAFNLIAQGAQNGLDKNGDLLDTINEYGVHYAQQGYNAEQFFNSLENGAAAGTFSIDKLGDAMKEFGIRSKDTANSTTEGFSLIGLDADTMRDKFAAGGNSAQEATAQTLDALFSMDDQVKQNQAGVDLFGTMWEDLGSDGVKALMDVNGEADKTADTMADIDSIKCDDVGSSLTELGRIIKVDVIQPIVNDVLPNIKTFIDKVKNLKQTFSDLSPVIAAVGTALAGLAITAMIGNFAKMIALIKSWTVVTKLQAVAQTALNVAMNMNPIGIVISLVAGLVAAFMVLWKKSDKFRAFWIGMWDKIKTAFSAVVTWFKTNWQTLITFLMNPIAGLFKYFYEHFDGFREFVDNFVAQIKAFFAGLWQGIKDIFTPVIEWFTTLFTSLWEGIKAIFTPVIEWFSELFSSVFQTISDIFNNLVVFFSGIWEIIKAIFTPVVEWFKEVFQSAWDGIKNIWGAVTEFFSGIWSGIKSVFSSIGGWFSGKFTSAWNGIKKAWGAVGTFFSGVWTAIKQPFSTVASWFKNTFKKAWEGVKNVFSTGGKIFDGIKDGISNVFTTVVNGIIKGINKVISVPFDAINSAIDWVRDLEIAGFNPFDDLETITVPQIPELAKGGVLKKGQTGYLEGDGDEAVVPLQKNTGWLDEIAARLREKLDSKGGVISGGKGSATVVNNFYQTNNSPKSLSRLEIYRQSKNLLSAKGV